jgi:membrane glycosyltransferase
MNDVAARLAPAHLRALPDAAAPFGEEALETPMPAEAPLKMPVQSLTRFGAGERRRWSAPKRASAPWLARCLIFGGALALTALGAYQMYKVVELGGVTLLEWILLVLFVVNFSWIALGFSSALAGFILTVSGRRTPPALSPELKTRTAIVMPIYNEAPARVFAALEAMRAEVEATGYGAAFDYVFLSDTTNPDIWIAEERALAAMRARLGPGARVWYRHRPKNTSRKAGNIADFVMRWGGAYDHMLVLDADSLMTGKAMVTLAAVMEADPDAGIIQTLPLIINRNTLFARVQQFAARIYGPIIATGLSAWMARDGNYWGHNAIIRTKAFADHCGLPDLRGKPPFGGHILSHDFVEAALIRRAGYAVYMLPALEGSYEESPPSLIDLAARDRRWCQGNLQHMRVMWAKGLHLASRQHFATGIMGYLASPFWLGQLLVGIALVLQASYIRPEYFSPEFSMLPAWPRFDAERSLQLFGLTMAVLLAPKLFGLLAALVHAPTRRASGGAFLLVISTLFESFLSALLAPVMMLIQSGSVFHILAGRDTGWNPQRRDDGSIPLRDIIRRHRPHVALGAVSLLAGWLISPSLVAWMSPTIAGLLLAVGISWASGQLSIGLWLKRWGLLATPEETRPPPIAINANRLAEQLAIEDENDALRVIHSNPQLRALHERFLPPAPRRKRGQIDTARAVAEAKLNDAETIGDAVKWLAPKERMVVLHDRALIALLTRLPASKQAPI